MDSEPYEIVDYDEEQNDNTSEEEGIQLKTNILERQYIVSNSINDNPKVIKPPRPNKPPKHPIHLNENYLYRERGSQNYENFSPSIPKEAAQNEEAIMLNKYQEKIRTQAKRIMELENKIANLINEDQNGNNSDFELQKVLEENQKLREVIDEIRSQSSGNLDAQKFMDQNIKLRELIDELQNQLRDSEDNQTKGSSNETILQNYRGLQKEKHEQESTLREECINSEKMRAHIEWLSDIAENRLKGIGFISTIEECGEKRVDVQRLLMENREELKVAVKKINDLEKELEKFQRKLHDSHSTGEVMNTSINELNERLNNSEMRYIAVIENENELRNEVSKFKASLRDSKGNLMLVENELETTKQENSTLNNVVQIVLNDQEKLLTQINFWHGEYLGRYVKGIIDNEGSRKQLQSMISSQNQMINQFEQKRGKLAHNVESLELTEIDEKLNDLISNQIKIMTNQYEFTN